MATAAVAQGVKHFVYCSSMARYGHQEIVPFTEDMICKPQEVGLATCSAEKARKLLGYHMQYTLQQGLSEMIDYIKNKDPKKFRYHLDVEIVNEKTPKIWTKKLF